MMIEELAAFRTIPVSHQNRFEDRISFFYIDQAKIIQSKNGVVALHTDEDDEFIQTEIQIPVASVALLSLGPGTSITNAALTSCARSGCVVQMTGGGGFPVYSSITPLTGDSRWAVAQSTVFSNSTEAKKVAKVFYKKMFGVDAFDGSLTQMRGVEGSLMRKIYANESNKYKLKNWRRDSQSDEIVNASLNIGNSILYGLASCLVQALCMNPALGIIHRGNPSSFLFDLADLYKPTIMIPLAFSMVEEKLDKPEDLARAVRRKLRKEIQKNDLMKDISVFLIKTFKEYTPDNSEDRLIGTSEEVEAHINHANSRSDKMLK